MDLQAFQQVLLGTLSEDQETIEQAQNSLIEMKQADYTFFLNFALQSIEEPINKRVPPISITLLYREAKSGNLFQDEKSLLMFVQVFSSNITSELLSPDIEDQFKMVLSSILSIVHIFIFKASEGSDLTIPNYILTTYSEIPDLKSYLMNCIYEIAIADPDLGGFDYKNLLEILVDDPENESLCVPRIHLYFALAKNRADEDIFHEMFDSIILQPLFNPDYTSTVIQSIANFSDINGYFFAAHATELFEKLLTISLNTEVEPEMRDLAILCIVSIVRNAPEMCKSFDSFYENIIARFVLIGSEINEDDPWDYDPNDDRPCQNALDAIGMIDEIIEDQDGLGIIFQMFQGVLNPEAIDQSDGSLLSNFRDGPDSWQAKYALITALSSMMNPYCNVDAISSISELIIPFIESKPHPRIRVAIYHFIKNATKFTHNATDIAQIINATIQFALSEDFPIAKQCAFKAIASYFKNLIVIKNSNFAYEKFFIPYFSHFLEELNSQPPEINKYIVQCVGSMAKAAKDNFKESVLQTSKLFANLLQHSESLSFNAEIISSYATCMHYLDFKKMPDQGKAILTRFCLYFLNAALQIYGNDGINEDETQDLTNAICSFLKKVKDSALPFVSRFLPNVLEVAQRDITVEQSQAFEGVFGLVSMYIQIPSLDSSIKQYVPRNDVIEVKQSLEILRKIVKILKNEPQFIAQVMEIAKHWICSDYFIEDLVFASIKILYSIVKLDTSNVDFIDFFLQCFVVIMNKYPNFNILWPIYTKVSCVLQFAKNSNWDNVALFENFLKGLPDLIYHAIQLKASISEEMSAFNNYDSQSKKLAFLEQVLSFVNEIVDGCYSISTDMTNQCISPEVLPKIYECLQNQVLLPFAASFISRYYIAIRPDIEQICSFCNFLMEQILGLTGDDSKNEITERLLEIFGDIVYKFDFGEVPKYTDSLVEFFNNYLQNVVDVAGDDPDDGNDEDKEELKRDRDGVHDTISDNANVAFAKLLLKNFDNVSDKVMAVYLWFEGKPLWGEGIYDSDFYYQFLIQLIEEKKIFEELEINWISDFLVQILSNLDDKYFKKENLKKFSEILREELKTEKGEMSVNEVIFGSGALPEEEGGEIRSNALKENLNILLSLTEPQEEEEDQ